MNTRLKGAKGEDTAVEYLLRNGYYIISRNHQSKRGEIDCIAKDYDGTLVFIEVKSTQSAFKGHPLYWVDKRKQQRIIRQAQLYLKEHNLYFHASRFDVIAIVNNKIEHLRNAFYIK